MADKTLDTTKHPLRIRSAGLEGAALIGAMIDEGFDRVTRADVEFVLAGRVLDMTKVVGQPVTLELDMIEGRGTRSFAGTCVSIEALGGPSGTQHYRAELRPWAWLLTRRRNCRVFQNKSVIDIAKEVLGDHGKSGHLTDNTQETYPTREFCLQYRESDLDFLRRLFEQEGIYFHFDDSGSGPEKLVIGANHGAPAPVPGGAVKFWPWANAQVLQQEHLFDWTRGKAVQTGKVTLNDYDFESPRADLKATVEIANGDFDGKDNEVYDYPAGSSEYLKGKRDQTAARRLARFRMEAEAARFDTVTGRGNVDRLRVGQTFSLVDHPQKDQNVDWLATRLVHRVTLDCGIARATDIGAVSAGQSERGRSRTAAGSETYVKAYMVEVEAMPPKVPYRPRLLTPVPRIAGIQTALVVGKKGEEIDADQYGRIKIQFHWDRLGKKDDTSSCFVRVAHPWTGSGWGAIAVPRIGQEVVVQFEEGDPDRPIVTGMLYNADTMPPWGYPANNTQSGLKTSSSKGGGGYHELLFEDKKGAEFVRMQSERNYLQTVKNNARRDIGNDLVQAVGHNRSQFVKMADTQLTGVLKDISVGLIFDEKIGGVMSQIVGIFKEEKVGFGKKDFGNAKDMLRFASATGGPATTVSDELFGTKFSDVGSALTYANAAVSAVGEAGKNEEIHGLSRLEVNGDREQIVQKGFSFTRGAKPGDYRTTLEDGKMSLKIKKGDYTVDIEKGSKTTTFGEGNQTTLLKKGNLSVKLDQGSVTIEAEKEIKLKVGDSTLTIDQQGLHLKREESELILKYNKADLISGDSWLKLMHISGKLESLGALDVKGKICTVKADAMLTVNGKLVKIN